MFFNEMWSFWPITEDTLSIGITFVFHIVSAMVVTVFSLKIHVFCLKLWKISSSYSVGKYKYGFWYNLKYMILNWPFQNRDVPCKTTFLYFCKSALFQFIFLQKTCFFLKYRTSWYAQFAFSLKIMQKTVFLRKIWFFVNLCEKGGLISTPKSLYQWQTTLKTG